ncbi:short chain dehydrogenase [Neisseria gonorrhoeae]|uniref:Short chain dehydrogenase n=1 Tax=Neisseria gonorrhoeae TaxID=485 RepID=A0A378VWS7_NEIGO|nr:short chain dehydrogenase [Neisseria gonorrhoeae]
MPTLTDKTILVTGASQGLGEQVAKAYAAEGATVILVARHQKNWKKPMTRLSKPDTPNPSPSVST